MHWITSKGHHKRFRPVHARWLRLAASGQALWLAGNLYEAVVDMPRLLRDAQPQRRPGLMTAGSPLRYYAPLAPLTFTATTVALMDGWRSGGDKRVVVTAAAHMAAAAGLTAYLVRTVNLPLLTGAGPAGGAEQQRMLRKWHRANGARLAAVTGAWLALRQLERTSRRS
jgi:Domain of unknown function (DUF1772)